MNMPRALGVNLGKPVPPVAPTFPDGRVLVQTQSINGWRSWSVFDWIKIISALSAALASGTTFLIVNSDSLSKIIHGPVEVKEVASVSEELRTEIKEFLIRQEARDSLFQSRLQTEVENNRKLGEALCELNNGPLNSSWPWCNPENFIKPVSRKKDTRQITSKSKYEE